MKLIILIVTKRERERERGGERGSEIKRGKLKRIGGQVNGKKKGEIFDRKKNHFLTILIDK